MKRIIAITITIIMLSTTISFAEQEEIYKPLEPDVLDYVAAMAVTSRLTIDGGKATYYTELRPQPGKKITKVAAVIKLVNSKGTVVQSKTATLYLSSDRFIIQNSKPLSSRGTYHAESTLKVYNGTKLIETIRKNSANVTY